MRDAAGRLHDALGRFARTGALKVTRDPATRRGATATAIRPHQSELTALKRYWGVTDAARAVREAYAQHDRGERVQEPHLIYYPGHHHQPLTMNPFDAIEQAQPLRRTKFPRHTTKRTASGRAYFERGFGFRVDQQGNEHPIKPSTPHKNLAGSKSAGKKRVIDIRTPDRQGRHAAGRTARSMMLR